MALAWYIRDMRTPGATQTGVSVTEAAWRGQVARYVNDVDSMEKAMTADTHFLVFPDIHLWMSTTGTFNPAPTTVNPSANSKPTHRRNDSVN